MTQQPLKDQSSGTTLRQAEGQADLIACFPVISVLRPGLKSVTEWVDSATGMANEGYRVLAAWEGQKVLAVAGYRMMNNLIHGHFLYVDDLVTAEDQRGQGLGAALLRELSIIAAAAGCQRLVLDTAVANTHARRFYSREGLLDLVVGFVKPLEGGK